MKVCQIHQTKHQLRQKTPTTPKNTNYAKKTPNTQKNTKYAKKHQALQKNTNYAQKKQQIRKKKHQLCKKNTKYAKKTPNMPKKPNTPIFIYAVLSRTNFCSKFTHFVGVLFKGLKCMVVYQNGQI